jgi:hypothetical protein
MSTLGVQAKFETLRSIDSATFTGSYQKIGAALLYPSVLMKFKNLSTVSVKVSFDGVNDHDIFPAGGGDVNDYGSDAQSTAGDRRLLMPAGTQVWVKAAAGVGLFYMASMYTGG